MVVWTAVLLIVGGICASAPLFKRAAKSLERFLVIIGFLVGIAVLAAAIILALGQSGFLGITAPNFSPGQYPGQDYYLVVMAVLGVLLFSRPLRKIRWASLIALGLGILAAAFLHSVFPGASTTILGVVFVIVLLIVYTVLRFAEDILNMIGGFLAFPPIAVIVGLVSIYYGLIIYAVG